jgi:hypothetical protein
MPSGQGRSAPTAPLDLSEAQARTPWFHHNLSALATTLEDKRVLGLPEANCAVVEDPDTAEEFLGPLAAAARAATDTLLVYFVGYGWADESGELFLALAPSERRRSVAAIPYAQIRQVLLGSPAARTIVILDCGYQGPPTPMRAIRESVTAAARTPGTYLLAAIVGEPMFVAPGGDFTAFTGELVRTIDRGIESGGPLLGLDAIYWNVHTVMQRAGLPSPQRWTDTADGELPLVRNQAYGRPPSPPVTGPTRRGPSDPGDSGTGDDVFFGTREADEGAASGADDMSLDTRSTATVRVRPPSPGGRGKLPGPDVGAFARPDDRNRRRDNRTSVNPPAHWAATAAQAAVRRGLLAFNPPAEMRQGRSDRVEVGIARSAALWDTLVEGMRGRGDPQFEEISTSTVMSVELKGDAFQVTGYSATEQVVAPTARWEFDVRPVQAGRQTLILCVCLSVALPGFHHAEGGRISVPVVERSIRIRVSVSYGARRFLAGNWQWLVGTAIGLGGGVAAWIALFH